MSIPETSFEFFKLIDDEKRLIQFLKDNNLCEKKSLCTGNNCDKKRRNTLVMFKGRLYFKCQYYKCCRRWSCNNNIFNFNQYSKLPVQQILSIIWYWSFGLGVKATVQQSGIDRSSVIKWFRKIRRYLYLLQLEAPPMGGPGFSIQIDESLFRGRRKYNRGRFKTGDTKPNETDKDKTLAKSLSNKTHRNYGNRVDGPWVFGMVLEKKSDVETKKCIIEHNKQVKKAYIRAMFPRCKKKRHQLYKDNRKLYKKIQNKILKATASSFL